MHKPRSKKEQLFVQNNYEKKWQKELQKYKRAKRLAIRRKLKSVVTENSDHCHLTGKFRGAGHRTKNLNV